MVDRVNNQRNYWNKVSSYYDEKYGYDTEAGNKKLLRKIDWFKRMGFAKGSRVLEIGCGTGVYSEYLYKLGIDLVSIDISEEMLRIASEKNNNINHVKGDMHNLPFSNQSFDAVVGFYVLQYSNLSVVLNEIHRVLKVCGKILFIEPNKLNLVVFAVTKVKLIKDIRHISNEASSFTDYELYNNACNKFNNVRVNHIEYGSIPFMSKLPILKRLSGSLVVQGEK